MTGEPIEPACGLCSKYEPRAARALIRKPGAYGWVDIVAPCRGQLYWRHGRGAACIFFAFDGGDAYLKWHACHGALPEGKQVDA